MNGLDMLENYSRTSEVVPCDDYSPNRAVSVVRKGEFEIREMPFISIQKGDMFFVGGDAYIANQDAYLVKPLDNPDFKSEDCRAAVRSTLGEEWYSEFADHNMECFFKSHAKKNKMQFGYLLTSVYSEAWMKKSCWIQGIKNPLLQNKIHLATARASDSVTTPEEKNKSNLVR